MVFILRTLLLTVIAVVIGGRALASEPLEDVLVTGSYAPLPAAELTSSVSVIDADRIAALNKRSIADLLKAIPGLLVEQQGGPGGLTAVSVRGGESNFTLVLLDGVPVNDPTNSRGGSFDFASLDPASVERIEIVRGPQSAVYGSDALGGVINIISRRGGDQPMRRLRGEWGEEDYRHYDLHASGALGGLYYAAHLSHRDDGEPVAGSRRDTDIAQLLLDWQPADAHFFSLNLRYLDGKRSAYPEQSGGSRLAARDDLDRADYRDATALLDWRARLNARWESDLRLSWFDHQETLDSPGIAPYTAVPPNSSDTDFERGFVHWINTVTLDANTRLHLGADWRSERGDSTGALVFGNFALPTDFSLDRDTTGVFAELRRTVGEALVLQGSLRRDEPDGFGGETTWALGARWRIGGRVELSANWGKAFKIPSFFALGHPLVGNPALRPETAESRDIGVRWYPGDRLDLKFTWFDNRYDDLIDFDPAQFTNVNRNRVKSRGAELELNWQPGDPLTLAAYAGYTDLDVVGEDSVLTGRPEWKAGAIARWQVSPALLGTLDYRWSDEQFAASRHTGETVVETLDTARQLDLNVAWQATPALRLELAVDNLTDQHYETAVGFPAPGRLLRAAVALEW